MDGKRFDDLSRRLATRQSRRGVLGLIGAAATTVLAHHSATAAPKKEKPTKCYGEGSHCTNAKQCCSSICTNRQCAAAVAPECTTAADCAGVDDECQIRTCVEGICGVAYTASGTPVSAQIPGDCQQQVCDGAGGTMSVPDDSDTPTVTNDCVFGTCSGGVPVTGNWEAGRPCESNGGFFCDGAGQCVVCIPGETQPCSESENIDGCEGIKICLPDGSGFDACVVPGVGLSCELGLPPFLECNQGTIQCLDGQYLCCSTSCTDVGGGPLCLSQ